MNHASVLHKRATLRKISIKVFINQHHHKPNVWCSGSAQQSYLRDPGSKPRCGLFFSPNSNTVYMSIKLIIPVKTTKNGVAQWKGGCLISLGTGIESLPLLCFLCIFFHLLIATPGAQARQCFTLFVQRSR